MKKNKKVSLDKRPFLVLTRRAIAGWVCFAFLVCAWMFFVGVLVGRETAPVKFDIASIQKKLEASRKALKNQEQLRSQGQSGIVKDKTKLDFYEALKDNREDTEIDKKNLSPSIGKLADSPPATKPELQQDGKTEEKIVEKESHSKSRSSKSSQERPEETAKSKSGSSAKTYTIQAASVKDARDADRLVASLRKKGFNAQRVIGKIPGKGIWYRVRIGEYTTRSDARNTLNQLKKAGLKPIIIEK